MPTIKEDVASIKATVEIMHDDIKELKTLKKDVWFNSLISKLVVCIATPSTIGVFVAIYIAFK